VPIGVSLQLFDSSTPKASLTGIQALWWDVTEPKDAGKPVGRSAVVTTDGSGYISLDLSGVSGLTVGDYGFLTLYRLDGSDHKDSLVFSGKVQTSTVGSGVSMQPVTSSGDWVRNPSWLALPSVADTEQKVVGLYRVNKDANFIAFTCAGNYTVNWGDGSSTENFSSGVSAYHEFSWSDSDLNDTNGPVTFTDSGDLVNRTAHGYVNNAEVKFCDIVSTTGLTDGQTYYVINAATDTFQVSATKGGSAIALTTDGSANLLDYKQVIVTITPQSGQNLTSVNFNVRHTATTVVYSTGWLDVLVSGTSLATLTVSASSQNVRWGVLEKFQLISTNTVTDFSYMFYSCYSLTSVPLLNTAAGTSFSNMFLYCYSLTSVPLLNTAAGTNFSNMFLYCYSLTSVPLLDTAAGTNFSYMFAYCYSLKLVPLLDTAAGTNFSNMFAYCYSLTSVPLLNTAAGTNFSSMFYSCYSLTSVPLLNTAAGTSFSNMFTYCYSLTVGALNGTTRAINYASAKLSGAQLDAIYNALGTASGAQTITVTSNYGASSDTPSIATAKGWTVTG
jgi:hypothetical protein